MALCTNRPEGFGPISHLHSHILTSCFLDTILVPLCTWLYLLALLIAYVLPSNHGPQRTSKSLGIQAKNSYTSFRDVAVAKRPSLRRPWKGHSKIYIVGLVLYYLLIIAQILMCVLEIVRLSLAHLGVGLLPFTFVALIVAGLMRATLGIRGKAAWWRWLNTVLWVVLAAINSIKIEQEVKEGINARKGTKYPVVDELTDVAVMVGVYVVLGMLEISLRP